MNIISNVGDLIKALGAYKADLPVRVEVGREPYTLNNDTQIFSVNGERVVIGVSSGEPALKRRQGFIERHAVQIIRDLVRDIGTGLACVPSVKAAREFLDGIEKPALIETRELFNDILQHLPPTAFVTRGDADPFEDARTVLRNIDPRTAVTGRPVDGFVLHVLVPVIMSARDYSGNAVALCINPDTRAVMVQWKMNSGGAGYCPLLAL